jgi:crotonobetaine/carnitine-CoA ligase
MRSEPDLEEDLVGLVDRQAERYGDRVFMTYVDGETLTFAQLAERVHAVGANLAASGVVPGQRVAIMMKNSLAYPVTWLGVLAAGGVAVPVNSRSGELDARFVLEHSGAVAVVVDPSTRDLADRAAPPGVRAIAMTDLLLPQQAPAPGPPASVAGSRLANIQYTSGTTGFPKGCLLTHAYWQRMGAVMAELLGLTERDTMLTSQPHSYIDPQWNVVAALRSGTHLVLLDGFHPTTFMRDVAAFGVTVFYCLGVMPTLLMKQPPAEHDSNAVTRVFCSAIPVYQHAAIEERWGAPWYEVFGMTESGVNIAVTPADHEEAVGAACLGRALPHNEAAVVDADDRPVAAGQVGELVLRGLGFMEGYHEDPEATAQFFRDGWAHTGDLCSMEHGGLIHYRGRLKEMIRRGGENIAPVQVETAIAAHPSVVECAVAPVPDDDLGEEVKAYVVVRADAEPDAAVLADSLRGQLASFKIPRYWEFRDSLPHTPSERIAKSRLEDGRADWRVGTVDLVERPI